MLAACDSWPTSCSPCAVALAASGDRLRGVAGAGRPNPYSAAVGVGTTGEGPGTAAGLLTRGRASRSSRCDTEARWLRSSWMPSWQVGGPSGNRSDGVSRSEWRLPASVPTKRSYPSRPSPDVRVVGGSTTPGHWRRPLRPGSTRPPSRRSVSARGNPTKDGFRPADAALPLPGRTAPQPLSAARCCSSMTSSPPGPRWQRARRPCMLLGPARFTPRSSRAPVVMHWGGRGSHRAGWPVNDRSECPRI